MLKSKELSDSNSCWNRARDYENVFVILERDIAAADTVAYWITRRIELGKNSPDDPEIIQARVWVQTVAQTHLI